MITGSQIRQGRELAGWSRYMLAFRATVALATLKRAEAVDGPPGISAAEAHRLERALDGEGVEFTDNGVRFRRSS